MMDIAGEYSGFSLTLREQGIAWIRFEREPGAYNGFTASMKHDLTELLYELNIRSDIRVLVLTGSDGAFSAGDDFKSFYANQHASKARTRHNLNDRRLDQLGLSARLRLASQKLTTALYELDLVTIAAINGICMQSALTLALACDFRVASSNAKLGSGTLRFGFMPDENGHFMLVRQIGVSKTLDFLLNKRILGAEDALQWGLVSEVLAPDQLEARALAMATDLAEGPQVAMRLLKRAVYRAYESDFYAAGEDIALRTAISDHDPDATEGVAAWIEKRKPKFNQGSKGHADGYLPGVGVAPKAKPP